MTIHHRPGDPAAIKIEAPAKYRIRRIGRLGRWLLMVMFRPGSFLFGVETLKDGGYLQIGPFLFAAVRIRTGPQL